MKSTRTQRPAQTPARRRLVALAGGFALSLATTASSYADEPAAPPPVAQACLACHGPKPVAGAPAIAGQASNFIQWQLVFFRTGRRKNQIMQAIAGPLSDGDIRTLGSYFASLPVPTLPAPADDQAALTKTGATLGEQRHCNSCHGENYLGQQAAPRLAHQPEAYLAKALIDYRSGARPSSGGAAMTEVAGGLSDEDIKAMAHYLAVLP